MHLNLTTLALVAAACAAVYNASTPAATAIPAVIEAPAIHETPQAPPVSSANDITGGAAVPVADHIADASKMVPATPAPIQVAYYSAPRTVCEGGVCRIVEGPATSGSQVAAGPVRRAVAAPVRRVFRPMRRVGRIFCRGCR